MSKYNEKLIQLETTQMKNNSEIKGMVEETTAKSNSKLVETQKLLEDKFASTVKGLEDKIVALTVRLSEKEARDAAKSNNPSVTVPSPSMYSNNKQGIDEEDLDEKLEKFQSSFEKEIDTLRQYCIS